MDLEDVLARAKDVRYRILDDEGVVIRQDAAEAVVVNELGARWIHLVDGRRSVAEILDQLGEEYDVERDTLERDSVSYLEDLVAMGLLVNTGASP